MKRAPLIMSRIFTVIFALLGPYQAMAACTVPLTSSQVVTLLSGKYACGTYPGGGDTWNELHSGGTVTGGGSGLTGGVITDYKLGPTDTNDPSKIVGSYSVGVVNRSQGQVTYNYIGGPTFSYVIQGSGTSYTFCAPAGGGTDIPVTVQNGHC